MLYHLFDFLEQSYNLPGAGLFKYITFRASIAVLVSLLISMIYGGKIINLLRRLQVGETVRDLGLEGQKQKEGTPTMGGLMILGSILLPTLLFARLDNVYILLMVVVTIWLGFVGFLDDYIKVFKKDKRGLAGKFKVVGQIGLGIILGSVLYFHEDVVVREQASATEIEAFVAGEENGVYRLDEKYYKNAKSLSTTIPFFKGNEFDYSGIIKWFGQGLEKWAFLIFIPIVIFIITAVSNGANMTDGLDGLATGTSAIIGFTLAIFAYVSGNIIFSEYLNIMYLPNSGELVIFAGSFVGACIGFLWHNAYPARVFMGDTGSLAIGGIIAALAIILRKELLLPVLCGIFLMENISVMMQVSYFKYTKKKFGEGRRIFKMAPLHHHYQKLGWHESKIVTRFWIVGILLAILTVVTLKIR